MTTASSSSSSLQGKQEDAGAVSFNRVALFLHSLIQSAHAPRVSSVLLVGAPGSGKSHIIDVAVDTTTLMVPSSPSSSSKVKVVRVSPLEVFSFQRRGSVESNLTSRMTSELHALIKEEENVSAPCVSPLRTLVVVLDRFDAYLASHDADSSLTAAAASADEDEDDKDSAGRQHSLDLDILHLVCPAFVAELWHWVRSGESILNELSAASGTEINVRIVFIVSTSIGVGRPAAASASISTSQLPPTIHPLVRKALFHWILEVPSPNYEERRACVLSLLSLRVGEALQSSSSSSLLAVAADCIAGRTGGVTYAGLQEVVQMLVDQCNRTQGGAVEGAKRGGSLLRPFVTRGINHHDGLVELKLGSLCEAAVRDFYSGNSQQALFAKSRLGHVDVVKTSWSDIAGLHDAKQLLQRLVVVPLRHRASYKLFGVKPAVGVLLHGPPGTGKTMLAKAMATELNAAFVFLDLPQLVHSEVGESERVLRQFFEVAKQRSPCVMFIDELQSVFSRRRNAAESSSSSASPSTSLHDDRLVTGFLSLLDEARRHIEEYLVVFVGATNVKDHIDPMLLRAGRLDTHIFIGNPDEEARRALVESVVFGAWSSWWSSSEQKPELAQALVSECVARSVGMSGAELRSALNVFGLTLFASSSSSPSVEVEPSIRISELLCGGSAVSPLTSSTWSHAAVAALEAAFGRSTL